MALRLLADEVRSDRMMLDIVKGERRLIDRGGVRGPGYAPGLPRESLTRLVEDVPQHTPHSRALLNNPWSSVWSGWPRSRLTCSISRSRQTRLMRWRWAMVAMATCISIHARCSPRQPRGPAENGKYAS